MTDLLAEKRLAKERVKALNEAGVKDPRGGHNRKSIEQHIQDGTLQPHRHLPQMSWKDVCFRPERKVLKGDPKWVRNAADERALAEGCWFDEAQAAYVCEWFAKHLRHCQGEWTGQPFELLTWQREEIIYPLFGWQRIDDRGRIVRRFQRTFIEIPKKNGKSTLASGVGLYMLVGEGQAGAQVYSYATDKDQAAIVHDAAIEMAQNSDSLRHFLRINRTRKHILNDRYALCYRAEVSRPAASQGKKGNCAIIDELHAWYGQELWDSVEKIGYAWPERLIFVITTAGNDTEHICYKQEEYAKAVERGDIYDRRLLVCIHQAQPGEDIRDAEVQDRVNPSLGSILSREDLNEEINRAEAMPREMAALLRYRFNIWQKPLGQWIAAEDWQGCVTQKPSGELRELPCVGGLDLARKRDTSALALVFEDGEQYHLRVWVWLPRERADQLAGLVSYLEWSEAGHVRLTDGSVTDYDAVADDIASIFEEFRPIRLAFDERYAEELTQRVAMETGVERIAFGQSMTNFAGPSARFEQLVLDGKLRHNDNPLLNWQLSNVQVKEDSDQNIRPMRSKRDDYKTIDTVVAAVMALGVMGEGLVDGYYEDNPLELV